MITGNASCAFPPRSPSFSDDWSQYPFLPLCLSLSAFSVISRLFLDLSYKLFHIFINF